MNNITLQVFIGFTVAAILSALLIPAIIKLAFKIGLVDLPNGRKVHQVPIPRIGGVAIFIGAIAGIFLCPNGWIAARWQPVFFSTLLLIFSIGIWDDIRTVSARARFFLQICCALAVANAGIRLTSLYGLWGIHHLATWMQYVLTVLVIAGTTNAFNLIDGVDGLAGGLAVIGLAIMGGMAWWLNLAPLALVLLSFTGAAAGFLQFNFNPARIFMGDGGSLVLGYLLSVSGILLIQSAEKQPELLSPLRVSTIVTSILVIPVFDTLRVFAARLRKGRSPFRADKTHIHHLLLVAGFDHKKTSFFLYGLELMLIVLTQLATGYVSVSLVILMMLFLFHLVTMLLRVNQEMERWASVIMKMEKNEPIY